MFGEPHLTILEQPIDKFRFRYKSEMIGTHGSIASANSSGRYKQVPTVQVCMRILFLQHSYLNSWRF